MNNLKDYVRKASPLILTCIGAVGVVATTVLAVKATPKAVRLIEQAEVEKSLALGQGSESFDGVLTPMEIIRTTWKCYIPTTIVGITTLSCIFGINTLSKSNQASMIGAYAILNESYKKYRQAAKDVYGEDADSRIISQEARNVEVSANGYRLYYPDFDTGEEVLFYDSYSERYFQATMAQVLNAQYHLNRNFILRGHVTLNELYEFLGIDKTDAGDDIGWDIDGLIEDGIMWLDFENIYTEMDDGLECYIISSLFGPSLLTSISQD